MELEKDKANIAIKNAEDSKIAQDAKKKTNDAWEASKEKAYVAKEKVADVSSSDAFKRACYSQVGTRKGQSRKRT